MPSRRGPQLAVGPRAAAAYVSAPLSHCQARKTEPQLVHETPPAARVLHLCLLSVWDSKTGSGYAPSLAETDTGHPAKVVTDQFRKVSPGLGSLGMRPHRGVGCPSQPQTLIIPKTSSKENRVTPPDYGSVKDPQTLTASLLASSRA